MIIYRVTYMSSMARNLITVEAKNYDDLIKKLDWQCIYDSDITQIKEGY
jgi:hypothetical protein